MKQLCSFFLCMFLLAGCNINNSTATPPNQEQTAPKQKTVQITFKAVDEKGEKFEKIDYAFYNSKQKVHDAMLRITKDSTVTVDLTPGEVYRVRFGKTERQIKIPDQPSTITFVVTEK